VSGYGCYHNFVASISIVKKCFTNTIELIAILLTGNPRVLLLGYLVVIVKIMDALNCGVLICST